MAMREQWAGRLARASSRSSRSSGSSALSLEALGTRNSVEGRAGEWMEGWNEASEQASVVGKGKGG